MKIFLIVYALSYGIDIIEIDMNLNECQQIGAHLVESSNRLLGFECVYIDLSQEE